MVKYSIAAGVAALAGMALPHTAASAAVTVLTFNGANCISGATPIECSVNQTINPAYGDGVGVDVSYRAVFANGNIAANSLQYRPTGTGDLSGAVISNTGPGVAGEILFKALAGYELRLLSLDAGCRNNASGCRNLPISLGQFGTSPTLFATLANSVGGHSSLTFGVPYSDVGYVLRFGPDGLNGGLDNIAFDVRAIGAVPEVSTWAMLIVGFAAVGSGLRRSVKRRPRLMYTAA